MLRRAVDCFLGQTWPDRELLVIHEDIDTATAEFIASLAHPLIRTQVVPATPHIPLGRKRQMSIEAARGRYIATWDDDDWSGPTRLADQMAVIQGSGARACTLHQWIAYDQLLGQAWLTEPRTWEASLLAERAIVPKFGDGERGEDFFVVKAIVEAGHMAVLNSPHLYVYLYHGANVGSRVHFKRNVFAHAQACSPAFSQRVAQLMASTGQPPLSAAEVQAAVRR